jgi:hypothetical protein
MKNEKIPVTDQHEFAEKAWKREQEDVIRDVVRLDQWKPAQRVTSAFKVFDLDPNDKNGGRYKPRVR